MLADNDTGFGDVEDNGRDIYVSQVSNKDTFPMYSLEDVNRLSSNQHDESLCFLFSSVWFVCVVPDGASPWTQ
jgi:hypothetical protein